MHFDTQSTTLFRRNEHAQSTSVGPKIADWACPLLENKKRFWRHKLVH